MNHRPSVVLLPAHSFMRWYDNMSCALHKQCPLHLLPQQVQQLQLMYDNCSSCNHDLLDIRDLSASLHFKSVKSSSLATRPHREHCYTCTGRRGYPWEGADKWTTPLSLYNIVQQITSSFPYIRPSKHVPQCYHSTFIYRQSLEPQSKVTIIIIHHTQRISVLCHKQELPHQT